MVSHQKRTLEHLQSNVISISPFDLLLHPVSEVRVKRNHFPFCQLKDRCQGNSSDLCKIV